MGEQQIVGRNKKFMSAVENFNKAKVLFEQAKKFIDEAINEDPANENKIREAGMDLFEKIRSAMFANLEEMREILGLPEE